ncbi:hypothetical protein SCHPADRAFT_908319 [Schizopora paradoxa]|uniref:DUF7770 domain-containing protein n=1 Tax=Schizopora paradoxa TaxID=27342 RepID=A0A0H2RBL6_9AGAM|nr:hypothetical protein SCHPADRAFT_908319 [Schizopora paradoxa]
MTDASVYPSNNSTIVFNPYFFDGDLDRDVTAVAVCGIPTAEDILHFHLYFELKDGQWPVMMVDMSPSSVFRDEPGSRTGKMTVLNKSYTGASAEEIVFRKHFPTSRPVTMEEILQLLKSIGRSRYIFDETGSGCRFWCQMVLADLEKKEIIALGCVDNFENAIQEVSDKEPTRYPMPVRRGQFY